MTHSGNSSMPDNFPSRIFLDGLCAIQPNPSGSTRALTIDNANGAGYLGIDYFEVISVTGGTPYVLVISFLSLIYNLVVFPISRISHASTSSVPVSTASAPEQKPTQVPGSGPRSSVHNATPPGVIVGPVVGGAVLLTFLGIVLYRCTRRRRRRREMELLREARSFNPEAMVRQSPDTRPVLY